MKPWQRKLFTNTVHVYMFLADQNIIFLKANAHDKHIQRFHNEKELVEKSDTHCQTFRSAEIRQY